MSVRSGQSITVEFTLRNFSTGAAQNGDSLPTGTLVLNGVDNGATVTVTNVATGRYKAQVTLPTLAVGDWVELNINATVNSITDNGIIWRDTKDILLDSSGDVTFNNINLSGSVGSVVNAVNVGKWNGTLVAGTTPPDAIFTNSGMAQGGSSNTITLASTASATDNYYNNQVVVLLSGPGTGESAVIASYVGAARVATINGTWAASPANNTTYALIAQGALVVGSGSIGSVTGSVGSVTGSVGGNVVGSVGSVTGAVGSVTAAVTVGGYSVGQDPATLVLDGANSVEGGGVPVTVRQALRGILASCCNKTNGGGTTAFNIRDTNDTKNRVAATTDASGNRTAVTLNLT